MKSVRIGIGYGSVRLMSDGACHPETNWVAQPIRPLLARVEKQGYFRDTYFPIRFPIGLARDHFKNYMDPNGFGHRSALAPTILFSKKQVV